MHRKCVCDMHSYLIKPSYLKCTAICKVCPGSKSNEVYKYLEKALCQQVARVPKCPRKPGILKCFPVLEKASEMRK